jgi:hypothetical protein
MKTDALATNTHPQSMLRVEPPRHKQPRMLEMRVRLHAAKLAQSAAWNRSADEVNMQHAAQRSAAEMLGKICRNCDDHCCSDFIVFRKTEENATFFVDLFEQTKIRGSQFRRSPIVPVKKCAKEGGGFAYKYKCDWFKDGRCSNHAQRPELRRMFICRKP